MKHSSSWLAALCAGASLLSVGSPAAAEPQGTLGRLPPSFAQGPRGPQADYFTTYQFMADPKLLPNETPLPYGGGNDPGAYTHLGITPGAPAVWEDGLRTDPNSFGFEWWYYDAHFADGSSLVLVYYTKPIFTPGAPLYPFVQATIVTPTGQVIDKQFFAPGASSFSKTAADMYIGPNHTAGNLQDYVLYAKIDDVEINLNMHGLVPAWRPGTGHSFYGTGYDKSFGWLPAIPAGVTTGTMTYGGQSHNVIGSGYHDHNWGNVRVFDHMKYWWWSRSQVGPYTVIAAAMRMKNRYGNNEFAPMFVVLDSTGALIDAAVPGVTSTHTEANVSAHPDPNFAGSDDGKIAHTVSFRSQSTNGNWAQITINEVGLLASTNLAPLISLGMTQTENDIAKLLGRNPWYTRFLGASHLSFSINGVTYEGDGLSTLELMDLE